MKTLSDYTIYCTEEQTKKVLELGAPIAFDTYYSSIGIENAISGRNKNEYVLVYNPHRHDDYLCKVLTIPTAEQLIGWLEEQGVWIHFCKPNQRPELLSYSISNMGNPFRRVFIGGEFPTRKKATLAAIDAALEYLSNNNLIK